MPHDKAPAFQFYPKDFLSDERVRLMSNTELGVYIKLLCLCWLEGSLPADHSSLARLVHLPVARLERLWDGPVGQCFTERQWGRLGNKRLDAERAKQEVYRRRQTDNGRKGGRPTNDVPEKPTGYSGLTQPKPKQSSPISDLQSSVSDLQSPVSDLRSADSGRKRTNTVVYDDDFMRFWAQYPKKVGKDDALRAWRKRKPDVGLVLTALIQQSDWLQREGGAFIPNPATWLNQGRWQDEPPTSITAISTTTQQNILARDRVLEKLKARA